MQNLLNIQTSAHLVFYNGFYANIYVRVCMHPCPEAINNYRHDVVWYWPHMIG